jgi:transposase-like protein
MAHKKYSADEKMAVVMSMLKSQKPVTQICKEYGISDAMAYRWRDEALEGMKIGLSDKRQQRHHTPEAEKDRLLKIIGQQAVIIDYQKKISQQLSL